MSSKKETSAYHILMKDKCVVCFNEKCKCRPVRFITEEWTPAHTKMLSPEEILKMQVEREN